MCSNNTSSGSYGDLQQDDYIGSGSCPKRQKNNKVRRRGPGVAELEKIRLQEVHKSSFSSSPSLPHIIHHHSVSLFAPPATKMNLQNPSSGAGRYYQFIEPPSNQRSCINNVLEDENQKMLNAMKRPWHLLTETTKTSVGPTTLTILRDGIQNRSKGISPVQDSGTTMSNPITIDSPTSIPSFSHHYPRFIPLGLQYDQQQQQQQQQQQKDFDEKAKWRNKKPFYSFISSDDRSKGDREQRPCDRYESAADHGIDLSLKL